MKRARYHDSVVLMLFVNQISTLKGVKKVCNDGCSGNKDICRPVNRRTGKRVCQRMVVVDVDDAILDVVMEEVENS